eukprot:CAMPEP_0173133960 /NCGR_PEP_ID=MMETSP1105-20130129/1015_1 /TAXON_ID=2985 /ORGANISM="Ochromonas sp., Strain BG-1" /LENGTH=81 /DNA_ID=CAMNT_0014045683 /DNA_START=551 /DNA_END=796 /DNA_ORIENTATION=+
MTSRVGLKASSIIVLLLGKMTYTLFTAANEVEEEVLGMRRITPPPSINILYEYSLDMTYVTLSSVRCTDSNTVGMVTPMLA